MAILQGIRNKAGLLVSIVIGLALFAFIMGDLMRSGRSLLRGDVNEIAEIGGNSVSYKEYYALVKQLTDNYKRNTNKSGLDEETTEQIREQAWETLVKNYVMQEAYESLGIDVSPEEVFDMVQGQNIDKQVMQIPIFKNKQTGQFDRALVIRFLKSLDQDPSGNARVSWLAFEKVLIENRKLTKFFNLIKKGYYVPKVIAKEMQQNDNKKVNFNYVVKNYASISDSTITVSDEAIKKYYNDHINTYDREESRDINYITFDIIPSEQDNEMAKKWINDIIVDFKNAKDDKTFIDINSDQPFDDKWYKQGELPAKIDSFMFASDTGAIYGPYFEDNAYKLSKLSAIALLPDSAKARHILIQPSEDLPYPKARALADSIKNLLKNGADFVSLARQYSADKNSLAKDGDLGWFKSGDMVKEFEDSVFMAKKGDIITTTSQFGIHVVEVEDKGPETKKVQVATIVRNVEPSDATRQVYYAKASRFAGENNTSEKFNAAIDKEGMTKRIASNLKKMDKTIAGLESPREVIKWAYTAEKGDISPVFELGDKFVVAELTKVVEKGPAPLEDVENEIKVAVVKEIKGQKLIEKFTQANAKTLEEYSSKLNLPLQNAENVVFSAYTIPGAGIEPEVIATATTIQPNIMSQPIAGNNGVFVLQVISTDTVGTATIESEQMKLSRDVIYRVDYQAYDALKKAANINDERSKFF